MQNGLGACQSYEGVSRGNYVHLYLGCTFSCDSTCRGCINTSKMVAPQVGDQKTDATRWRLRDVGGEQTWHYLSEEQAKEWPQTTADKYFLGLPTVCARQV